MNGDVLDKRPRIPVVDNVRGLAALAVAWFHFTNGGSLVTIAWLRSSGALGWLGVEAFFVISGFIIPYSMMRGRYRLRKDIAAFVVRRIVRLDPPYLVAIAISVGLSYLAAASPAFRGNMPDVSYGLLVAHLGYLTEFFGYSWVNPVFWSLAIEFQFYLLIAMIFPLVTHRLAGIRVATVLAACVLCLACPPQIKLVFLYLALFGIGITTFQRSVGLTSTPTFGILLLLTTAVTALKLGALVAAVAALAAMAIVFMRSFSTRLLTFCGSISYPIYLVHVPIGGRIVNLGTRLPHTLAWEGVVLCAAMAASIACAYALHVAVERPAQRWSSALSFSGSPRFGQLHARPVVGLGEV